MLQTKRPMGMPLNFVVAFATAMGVEKRVASFPVGSDAINPMVGRPLVENIAKAARKGDKALGEVLTIMDCWEDEVIYDNTPAPKPAFATPEGAFEAAITKAASKALAEGRVYVAPSWKAGEVF